MWRLSLDEQRGGRSHADRNRSRSCSLHQSDSTLSHILSSISTGNKRYYETLRMRGESVLRPC